MELERRLLAVYEITFRLDFVDPHGNPSGFTDTVNVLGPQRDALHAVAALEASVRAERQDYDDGEDRPLELVKFTVHSVTPRYGVGDALLVATWAPAEAS